MRLAIVEDHDLIRDSLKLTCSTVLGHTVVGAVATGRAALDIIARERPEVVLLDLDLPDIHGFEVATIANRGPAQVRFLVISGYLDDNTVDRAVRTPVHGFLDKESTSIAVLGTALEALAAGGTYFSRNFQLARRTQQSDPDFFAKILTERERTVLSLVGQGLSDREIAQALKISVRTAQTHRSNLMHKLKLGGTPKLIAFAIEHGITHLPAKEREPDEAN